MTALHRATTAATLFCIALLTGCAAPGTSVILLPQADSRPSAVVIKTQGGERVLDRPYARATATAGSTAAPTVDQADATQLQSSYSTLFALMPPAAQRFELLFDSGGTLLTAVSQQTLAQVLAAANARSGSDMVVIGYTDTVGTPRSNDELSLRRAMQVKQLLSQRGFPVERIEAAGRGMRELAVPTADGVNEPRNRRVTVVVR